MTSFFRDRTIEKRVMSVVRTAIDAAQDEHDREVEAAKTELEETIKKANEAHEEKLLGIIEAGVKKVFAQLRS